MIQTGRVVDGKVVVDADVPLREGAIVSVVVNDDDAGIALTASEEDELAESLAQIKRGEGTSLASFRSRLRTPR